MKHFLGSDENAQASTSLTVLYESEGTHEGGLKSSFWLEVTSVEDTIAGRKHGGQVLWASLTCYNQWFITIPPRCIRVPGKRDTFFSGFSSLLKCHNGSLLWVIWKQRWFHVILRIHAKFPVDPLHPFSRQLIRANRAVARNSHVM